MKVILDNFQQIEIPLKKPFRVGDILVDSARSFTYSAHFGETEIKGEIPSLELFYPDQQLAQFQKIEFDFNKEQLDFQKQFFAQILPIENPTTNFIFSIEQLILTYLSKIDEAHQDFYEEKPEALLNSLDTGVEIENTSSVCKLKIGRNGVSVDRNRIESYMAKGIKLRLDGNRMCSVAYLEELLSGLNLSTIDYIEEPFATISEWDNFTLKDSVGLAVDESLEECLTTQVFPHNTVAAIIKPSLILSISGVLAALNNSQLKNIHLVISSSFETPLSFNILVHLASRLPIHHGLGTMEHLNFQNPKQNPFKTIGDKIHGFPLLHFQL